MTDYEMFMKVLNAWVNPNQIDIDDIDNFYINDNSITGTHWVTVIGEDNQEIEFDFNPDGKIIGWF